MSAYATRIKAQMAPLYESVQELDSLDELTDQQKGDYDRMIAELSELKTEFDKAVERSNKAQEASDMIASLANREAPRARTMEKAASDGGHVERKALSSYIIDSFSFKSASEVRPGDAWQFPRDLLARAIETKAAWIPGNLNLASGPIQIFGPNTPRVPHPLLQLLPRSPWGNFAVPYLRPAFTNNAAVVPMGTPKPESTNVGNVEAATMQTIATWKEVPRQLLRYIPGVRQVLDDELIGAIQAELVDQVINGAGGAGQFNGLLSQVTQTTTGASLPEQILNGIGLIATQGGQADGIVLNPADYYGLMWVAISSSDYQAPIVVGDRMFGVQVAIETAMPAGTALVGDFGSGARLYDGENANVRATEGPNAKSNLITLIAELDAVLVVGKPNYFVEAVGTVTEP